MAVIWYPSATRTLAPSDGGSMLGGPLRTVLHTTEGSSASGAIAAMRQHNSWSHLTVSFEHGRLEVWQHIPFNRAARALKHPAGTVDTNRMGSACIQVEIVGFATRAALLPPPYLDALAVLLRQLERYCGVPRRSTVRFIAYPASYGANNGVRLTAEEWRRYSGICGHQHVPGNEHGDPGAVNITALLRDGQPAPAPPPDPTPAPAHRGWLVLA